MTPLKRLVTASQLLVVALLVGQALVTVLAAGRDIPADALWDDDQRAAATVGRAFDIAIAIFVLAEAAAVLLALRTWLRSRRWTLLFLTDLIVAIPAMIIASPFGPSVGDLTAAFLAILATCSIVAALLALRSARAQTA